VEQLKFEKHRIDTSPSIWTTLRGGAASSVAATWRKDLAGAARIKRDIIQWCEKIKQKP